MLRILRNIISVGLLFFISFHAQATIIGGGVTSGGGTFMELTVPFSAPVTGDSSVGNDTFQTLNLYAFNEDQNIIIPGALTVNVGSSPIPAGTVVASHYVFFDPNSASLVEGYVDFDSNILGILTSTSTLAASDYLINNGVTYLNPGARGLEAGDTATIDSTFPYRVDVHLYASTPGDYIRVLTEQSPAGPPPTRPVPEPTTLALLGLGLAGLRISRRKKA